ncbi:hypothetical protein H0H92_001113 [Tricholoma furcatifolium]|nr:hypothetical protein H0H92_001113 [Tricholoma furcatifolium]
MPDSTSSPSTPSPDDATSLEAEVAHLKHKLAEKATTPQGPNKRLVSTITHGRSYWRFISLFENPGYIVLEADHRHDQASEAPDEDDEQDAAVHARNRNRTYEFIRLIPGAKLAVDTLADEHIASWVNMLNKEPNVQPLLDPEDRANHGLQHDTTGRYAFASLFTSPSSANRVEDSSKETNTTTTASPKATKSGIAMKRNIDKVTSHSIAYTAVLLYFSLTNASSWKSVYNGFSYQELYNFVIDYLEDKSTPIAKANSEELLRVWNNYLKHS